ncbi:MAG TPA: M48 family metalloprotease [Candidatus Dormibacteraeota bacterium]|nr:M48 family metalloprotease [Candidatus Dormibacteraeota bacterium]
MYSQIAANKRKTFLLMAVFVAFVSTIGYIFAQGYSNPGIFYFVGIGALVYSIVTYFMSAKIALGMSGAHPIAKKDAPQLYRMVENLSITAGLPMPKVYLIDDPAPNAFATGRNPNNAVVAVTTGLIERLEDEEVEGVLAHEMAHIGNYDIRLMSVTAALVSIISLLSDFFFHANFFGGEEDSSPNPIFFIVGIVMALLAPLIATVIQLAVSRRREYLADATAALLTRYPEGLASALEKISAAHEPVHHASTATAHLYIASPFGPGKGVTGGIARLFSTHPPAEDRIAKLRAMEHKP